MKKTINQEHRAQTTLPCIEDKAMTIHRKPYADLIQRAATIAVVVCSLLYFVTYLYIALARITYPFELEWLEGLSLQHVKRVMGAGTLYDPPSLDFVPNLYPPLHAYLGAIVGYLFGASLFTLRALSMIASLGVMFLIHKFVSRETCQTNRFWNVPALVAVGLFVGTFNIVGGWFDIARIDSVFMFFILLSIYILRFYPSPRGLLVAGLAIAASGFVKQSGFVLAVPIMAAVLIIHRRKGAIFCLSFFGISALTTIFLVMLYEDWWFTYYVIDMPSRHPKVALNSLEILWRDLISPMPIACGLAACALLSIDSQTPKHRQVFLGAFLIGSVGISWLVRKHVGAFLNDTIPAYAALSLLAGVGLDRAIRLSGQSGNWRWAASGACLLLLYQFSTLRYDPFAHIPTAQDRAAGEFVIAQLKAIPGDVFLPHHGYLAEMAGKRSFAHTLAIDNLMLEDPGPQREKLGRQIVDALAQHSFSAVILESDGWRYKLIGTYYRPLRSLYPSSDVFFPRTGAHLRPETIFVPRRDSIDGVAKRAP